MRQVTISLALFIVGCTTPPGPPIPGHDAGPPADAAIPDPTVIPLPDVGQVEPLPPISGGNLLATRTGLLVATDPDRATVWVLDPEAPALIGRVSLEAGDEPGRLAEDDDGIVHVVLRRAGAVLSVDPRDASVRSRRAVCPAPRGIDVDHDAGLLWVACAGGELVALPPAAGDVARSFRLDDDLRDVVASDGVLYVSRLRSAEVLSVDPDTGVVIVRRVPLRDVIAPSEGTTGWRLRAAAEGGGVILLHQRAMVGQVAGSYGQPDGCGVGVVSAALSYFPPGRGAVEGRTTIRFSPLSVDFVEAPGGALTLMRAATDAFGPGAPTGVMELPADWRAATCLGAERAVLDRRGSGVGVDRLPDGRLVSLYRDPLRVVVGHDVVFEGAPLARDRGFEMFHSNTPSMTTCASCHPEGGDDGHAWDFGDGRRRTQSLLGGILETAPFHWAGDQADMSAIMDGGFVSRMGGRLADVTADVAAMETWLDAQPLPARSIPDADAVVRGAAVFETAGCGTCHAGPVYTNGESLDLGEGVAFQVPSLRGVRFRAPFFHDGCAPTLFTVLRGTCQPGHAGMAPVAPEDEADLVAYLESL
ncbi:MAG: cytochrome-c peroxidase [Myxococcales bacterium]|nr:cytochrome-c peroxidase [Myxococcales bacterium]